MGTGPILLRAIRTDYYNGKELIKTNRATYPNSAVLRCVDHMQLNDYGATTAEVFDEDTGELHAVVKFGQEQINILYKREVQRGDK